MSELSFLAENVNLYNWHLLRGPNPNRYMYDETEEAMCKLYYNLFKRAEENNDVSIKLTNTVLKLGLTDDETEDNNVCARLLSNFIQKRQRGIHLYNSHPESERMLWYERSITTNDLYTKLHNLEMIYIDILLYDNNFTELRKNSYNYIPETEYENVLCPLELGSGSTELELENVYLSHLMGYVDLYGDGDLEDYDEQREQDYDEQREQDYDEQREQYYDEQREQYYDEQRERYYDEYMNNEDDMINFNKSPPSLKIVDTNIIMEFDCPICLEAQTIGSQCVTTTCEHQYCAPCFENMTQHKRVCAMCRRNISEYIVSIVA
jgi:hypothetical protein